MKPTTITYRLQSSDDKKSEITINLDSDNVNTYAPKNSSLPNWTHLDFNQCLDCPLSIPDTKHCPAAVHLIPLINQLSELYSYDQVHVDVIYSDRSVSLDTTAQRIVSSILGLIMATSGCPNTAFLKPMAHFHIPLASEEETIYRATSMYLLAQYFRMGEDLSPDLMMDGLTHNYQVLQRVNKAMANRLRCAAEESTGQDAGVNAVILLDLLAKAMPLSIDESLSELRYLFSAYLTPDK